MKQAMENYNKLSVRDNFEWDVNLTPLEANTDVQNTVEHYTDTDGVQHSSAQTNTHKHRRGEENTVHATVECTNQHTKTWTQRIVEYPKAHTKTHIQIAQNTVDQSNAQESSLMLYAQSTAKDT